MSFVKIYVAARYNLCTMKINAAQLLNELTALTRKHLQQVQEMQSLPDEVLNSKPLPESWNALECIEHLNRYGRFYLPEMEEKIKASDHRPGTVFRSGWLGNYFANSMLPREKLNKMKTFRSMNPVNTGLNRSVLDTFASQLQKMLLLLQLAANTDLTKVKTAISISSFIKLRLGDTLRVVIYHNERHLRQAESAMRGK